MQLPRGELADCGQLMPAREYGHNARYLLFAALSATSPLSLCSLESSSGSVLEPLGTRARLVELASSCPSKSFVRLSVGTQAVFGTTHRALSGWGLP